MTLQDIVDRCSRYSGWNLEYRIEERHGERILTIEDPSAQGRSSLVLALHPEHNSLREVYGRMRHWGISRSREEYTILRNALALGPPLDAPTPSPSPKMISPFDLDAD